MILMYYPNHSKFHALYCFISLMCRLLFKSEVSSSHATHVNPPFKTYVVSVWNSKDVDKSSVFMTTTINKNVRPVHTLCTHLAKVMNRLSCEPKMLGFFSKLFQVKHKPNAFACVMRAHTHTHGFYLWCHLAIRAIVPSRFLEKDTRHSASFRATWAKAILRQLVSEPKARRVGDPRDGLQAPKRVPGKGPSVPSSQRRGVAPVRCYGTLVWFVL